MSTHYNLITSNLALQPLLDLLDSDMTPVALDTEADSMHHYREKLCLIQLGVCGEQWIIDPLSDLDLVPLFDRLALHKLIIQGADYDLRLLNRFHGFQPGEVFDTMLAAQLLGFAQIGLANLVHHYCAVTLVKRNQLADWAERPLSPELLAYAADDTRYLWEVAARMETELAAAGRLEWHTESCARAVANTLLPRPERNLEQNWRIKGGKHLRGRAAAVLRELWTWRENLARKLDRPPFKVAPGELLLNYALWADAHPEESFYQAPPRPSWLRGSRLHAFEAALAHALGLPARHWPLPPEPLRNGLRLTRTEEALLMRLLAARDYRARELGIEPGVLGPRDAIKCLIREKPTSSDQIQAVSPLMAWQAEALAPVLLPVLNNLESLEVSQPSASE